MSFWTGPLRRLLIAYGYIVVPVVYNHVPPAGHACLTRQIYKSSATFFSYRPRPHVESISHLQQRTGGGNSVDAPVFYSAGAPLLADDSDAGSLSRSGAVESESTFRCSDEQELVQAFIDSCTAIAREALRNNIITGCVFVTAEDDTDHGCVP